MGKRGRPSAAALSVVVTGVFDRAIPPPGELTPDQAAIWTDTVASEPPDFFRTAALQGLLTDYCRHRASAEMLSGLIDAMKPGDLADAAGAKRYYSLLRARDLETRAVAMVATKLRITNQSRYAARGAARAAKVAPVTKRPWE